MEGKITHLAKLVGFLLFKDLRVAKKKGLHNVTKTKSKSNYEYEWHDSEQIRNLGIILEMCEIR